MKIVYEPLLCDKLNSNMTNMWTYYLEDIGTLQEVETVLLQYVNAIRENVYEDTTFPTTFFDDEAFFLHRHLELHRDIPSIKIKGKWFKQSYETIVKNYLNKRLSCFVLHFEDCKKQLKLKAQLGRYWQVCCRTSMFNERVIYNWRVIVSTR